MLLVNESKDIWDYNQPDFYHFSDDSVWLAKTVSQILKNEDTYDFKALDLCSGCGVVGMEIVLALSQSLHFDFIELQSAFGKYFDLNVKLLGLLGANLKLINQDFRKLYNNEKLYNVYDLVVSNPPYFEVGKHRLSTNTEKNICRFFKEGSFAEFIQSVMWVTKKGGRVFFLSRGFEANQVIFIASQLKIQIKLEILEKKSDTFLVLMLVGDKY